MRISKPLVYCNVAALVVNGCIVWLTIVKYFPLVLGVVLFIGCLSGLVWLSCKLTGHLPAKQPRYTFYSAPTEEVEQL